MRHLGTLQSIEIHPTRFATIAATFAILAAISLIALPQSAEALATLADVAALSDLITRIGPWAVILLLALAVIISPIPSGPIAMAAGALYGPLHGGALTAAGAIIGASGAFALSRGLGYRPLSASSMPLAGWITRPRPQSRLMLVVLVSRLIPFISFDAVSYIAGLTQIRPRYFVLATTIGVLPASFAFAALGAGMADLDNVTFAFAALGITLLLPVGWMAWRQVNAMNLGRTLRLHTRK